MVTMGKSLFALTLWIWNHYEFDSMHPTGIFCFFLKTYQSFSLGIFHNVGSELNECKHEFDFTSLSLVEFVYICIALKKWREKDCNIILSTAFSILGTAAFFKYQITYMFSLNSCYQHLNSCGPPSHKDFQQMALIQWLPTDGTNTVTSNRWHKNLWLPTDGTNTVTSNRWHKNLWHPLKSCMYVHNAFFHPFLAFLTKHINILQHDWGGIHPRTCLRGHWN